MKQSHNFWFFGVDLAQVSDSFTHACFLYSVFNELKAHPDVDNWYIIGLLGDSDIPSKSHFGVFSSILFNKTFSFFECMKIIDFIWERHNNFFEKYREGDADDVEGCDRYVIKCVPLTNKNGGLVLKKGVIFNEGALQTIKIPRVSYKATEKKTKTLFFAFGILVLGVLIGKWI